MTRRVVYQQSVAFEMPPGLIERAPEHLTGRERVQWYERTYAAYPAWLALFIKGGWDYGGLTVEQPALTSTATSGGE